MATSENAENAENKKDSYRTYGRNPDIAFVFPCSDDGEGSAVILAEKLKLAEKSDVMKKQFNFSQNPDEKLEKITISDISFDTFNELMKEFYGSPITIHKNNYANLLYASRKYFVDDLTGKIIMFLRTLLNGDNLLKHLDFLEQFQIKTLNDLKKEICIKNPLKVISNLTNSATHREILNLILESPYLNCSEFDLYNSVVCMMRKQPKEFGCPRKALGNSFNLIRFPTMSVTELVACGNRPSLLTPEELLDFQQWAQNKVFSNTLQLYSLFPRVNPMIAEFCYKCRGYRRPCKKCNTNY